MEEKAVTATGGSSDRIVHEVSTTFQRRLADLEEFGREFNSAKSGRMGRLTLVWYLAGGGLVGAALGSLMGGHRLFIGGIAGAIGSVASLLVIAKRMDRRRRYRFSHTPNLQGPQTWTFGPEGVKVSMAHSTLVHSWRAFYEALETTRFFILRLGPLDALALPKWALLTEKAVVDVRSILEARMGSRFKRVK